MTIAQLDLKSLLQFAVDMSQSIGILCLAIAVVGIARAV